MFASAKRNSRKVLLGLAASGLVLAATVGVAEAKHKHKHHHFHGSGIVLSFGGPSYGYGYEPSCYWLKRKAIHTGSPYWWKRYRFCMGF
jgi:hypothetical protein